MTRVIYTNNKPFKPSIKLEPFINISKQKEVKKILKTAFSSKSSKKFNLEDNISWSKKITEIITIVIWKKNLFFGEIKIFWSENKPTKKIRIKFRA